MLRYFRFQGLFASWELAVRFWQVPTPRGSMTPKSRSPSTLGSLHPFSRDSILYIFCLTLKIRLGTRKSQLTSCRVKKQASLWQFFCSFRLNSSQEKLKYRVFFLQAKIPWKRWWKVLQPPNLFGASPRCSLTSATVNSSALKSGALHRGRVLIVKYYSGFVQV